jgi:hypothetical protein
MEGGMWLGLGLSTAIGAAARGAIALPVGPVRGAAIDAAGTSVVLDVEGAAGGWGDYALAGSDGAARVVLNALSPGHRREGEGAVAAMTARRIEALIPARTTPIAPESTSRPNADRIDERETGEGQRRVRLWLSRPVYAGEALTLGVSPGWRAGAGRQNIAVANDSTLVAAPPIARWLTVPRQRVTGPFRVEMLAGSLYPHGGTGVAAIRFSATDGERTVERWATALSTSPVDGVRCWAAEIDPGALSAGPVTVHADIHPHVGPVRSTGSGTTIGASEDGGAMRGLAMAHDPDGARYPEAWLMLDPVAGTLTATAAMVRGDLDSARAMPADQKPRSLSTALQALYLANRSAVAANGGAALSRMADGARIVLPAGVSPVGGTAVTTGLGASECWPIVMGDPADPDPRAHCVLQSAATAPNTRAPMLCLRDLTVEIGGAALASAAAWWLDRVAIRHRAGQEASALFFPNNAYAWFTQCDTMAGAFAIAPIGNTGRPMLARSCVTHRGVQAPAIIGCAIRGAAGGWNGAIAGASDDSQADWLCVGNRILTTTGGVGWPTRLIDGYQRTERALFLNNVVERTGGDPTPIWAMGENALHRCRHVVIEGNSIVGERANTLYNDPPDLTSSNDHEDCRVANNYFDWLPTKHDDFYDDTTAGTNGGAPNFGYRPWLTSGLWFQSGVGCEGNALGQRIQTAFVQRHAGPRSVANPAPGPGDWARFTADRSRLGTGEGDGDYRPLPDSPLLGLGRDANLDVDIAGHPRVAPFAAGAHEGM